MPHGDKRRWHIFGHNVIPSPSQALATRSGVGAGASASGLGKPGKEGCGGGRDGPLWTEPSCCLAPDFAFTEHLLRHASGLSLPVADVNLLKACCWFL